jgi:hypothetical protein
VYTCYDVCYCRYVLPDAYLPIVLPQLQGEAEVAPTTGTDTARRTDYLELLSQLMKGTAPATLLPHLAAIVAALTGSASNSSSSSGSGSTASALPALTAAPTNAVTDGAAAASHSAGIVSAAAAGTEAAVTQTAISLAAVTLGDSDSPAVRAATLTALHSLLATVCRAGSSNTSSNSSSSTTTTAAAAAAAAGSAARAAVQAHFLKTGRLATLDVLSRGAVAYALACRAALAPAADSVLQLLAVLGGWQTVGALVSAHGCALVASCLAAWPSVAAWTLGSQQQAVLSQVLLGFAEGKTGCASQLPGIVAIIEVCHHYILYLAIQQHAHICCCTCKALRTGHTKRSMKHFGTTV